MALRIRLFKQRQKFAAAHFTIYPDGSAERLHGHNYTVEVVLHSKKEKLGDGLLVPFQEVKDCVNGICEEWNERVLMPSESRYLEVDVVEDQVNLSLVTPLLQKKYSLPREDVVLLECDNISSENMAVVTMDRFLARLPLSIRTVTDRVTVTVSEGPGSEASVEADVPSPTEV